MSTMHPSKVSPTRRNIRRPSLWQVCLLWILAFVFTGSCAVFLARIWKDDENQPIPMQTVVVARKKLTITDQIRRDHFKVIEMPLGLVPEGHYRNLEELFPIDSVSPPRTLKRVIYPNEILLSDRVSDPQRGDGLQSLMAKNQLAFSFDIDSLTSRSQVVYPGAQIDVLATFKRPEQKDAITQLIAQNLKVLRVNQISDPSEFQEYLKERKDRSRSDVLTILARDLEQAQTLTHASSVGKLSILLRNTQDLNTIQPPGVTTKQLSLRDDEQEQVNQEQSQVHNFRKVSRPNKRSVVKRRSSSSSSSSSSSVTTIDL